MVSLTHHFRAKPPRPFVRARLETTAVEFAFVAPVLLLKRFRRFCIRFIEDRDGVSAILVGLCLSAMLGGAGLAVDIGLWYADRRAAQGAADAAAYSAAVDYSNSTSPSVAFSTASARAVAAQYGFTNGTNGVTVTVNSPPTSGNYTAASYYAFEVIITKPETLFFSKLFISSASIKARAVAIPTTAGEYCMEILNTTAGASNVNLNASNGATINMPKCGIADNGPGSCAMTLSGGADLTMKSLSVVGNYCTSNGASVSVTGTKTTGAAAVADPYASVSLSSVEASTSTTISNCNHTNASYTSGSNTLSPGVYCGGLNISNGATATMSPGVYYVVGNTFTLGGGSTVTADGVTIILTGSGSNYATAQIANGVTFNLTAPTTGSTAGIAMWADSASPTTSNTSLAGGANFNITGALYFPTQQVSFSNGASNNTSCLQLIAYDVTFSGSGTFSDTGCAGTGARPIGGQATPQIVE